MKKIDWVNAPFVVFSHVMAAVGIALAFMFTYSWWSVGLAVVWLAFCGLSITGGYHRLFSHMTYRAHPLVRLFYLLFGAASIQNSALKWCSDHRRHHQFTDEAQDPYNIKLGFWWAHIGWVLSKEPTYDFARVPDLAADPLVRFQHRWYVPLAVGLGWLAPALLGLIWGDPLGAFFLAGWVRLIVQWHSTFCVNSVAHMFGRRPYTDADSARDSFVTALITMGEGYHNFHHAFPWDYRNGVARHQFDPTKWVVHAFSKVGLTWDLKRVPAETILRARLTMDAKNLTAKRPEWETRIAAARAEVDEVMARWQALRLKYADRRAKLGLYAYSRLRELRQEVRSARREFKIAYRLWRSYLRQPELLPAVA
jgi:stearoyl-CoA desaturase (delta-9 desaturase)